MRPYRIGAGTLEARIAQLRGLGREGLCARWRSLDGRTAPAFLPKHLLLRLLAYRPQVDALGERGPANIRNLDQRAGERGSLQDRAQAAPLPDAGQDGCAA
jgi:hypothetical protein